MLLGGGKIAAISKRFGYAKYRGFDSARIVRYADERSIKKEKGKVSEIKREMFVGTEEATFRKIIEAVQNMGETGATIEDLSKIARLERHTLSKHLNRLRADGRLSYKRIGRAKVMVREQSALAVYLQIERR